MVTTTTYGNGVENGFKRYQRRNCTIRKLCITSTRAYTKITKLMPKRIIIITKFLLIKIINYKEN